MAPYRNILPFYPADAPRELLPDPLESLFHTIPLAFPWVSRLDFKTILLQVLPQVRTQSYATGRILIDSLNQESPSAPQSKAPLTSQQLNRILDHYGHQDPFVDFDTHIAYDSDQDQQYTDFMALEKEVRRPGPGANFDISDVNEDPFPNDALLVESIENDAVWDNSFVVPLDLADSAATGSQEDDAEHGIDPSQLAPYPLPLHPDAARAILHVPMAKVPEHSLLQLHPRISGRIMKEFLDPGQPLPRSATLLDILEKYMNHLWYEGMDAFIQIRVAPVDLIRFIPKRDWVLLRRYGIWNSDDPRNWLQKRLEKRKSVLGQAYIDALRKAPRIREPGAAFGNSARDRALKTVASSKVRKPNVTDKPLFEFAANMEQSFMSVPASLSSNARRPAVVMANAVATTTRPPAFVTDGTFADVYQPANLPPLTQRTTRSSQDTNAFPRPDTIQKATPSSPELEQTSLQPEFRPVDPLTFAMNFDLTAMPDFQSFFSEHISARSSPGKPLGTFLFLTFWDTTQEYLHAKKQFTDRTHECMKLAGELIAADPTLRTADRLQQLEVMLFLMGQDIFTRKQEFLTRCAAMMEGVLSADGLRQAFNIVFNEVVPFCLSDAIESASYSFLIEHVGEHAFRQPELFTYDLLTRTRAAAIASVSQTQDQVRTMFRQWQQMQTANPTGFELQNLIPAAVRPTASVVPSTSLATGSAMAGVTAGGDANPVDEDDVHNTADISGLFLDADFSIDIQIIPPRFLTPPPFGSLFDSPAAPEGHGGGAE